MTIASVLRDKGNAVETIAADSSVYDAVRRLGEKRIGALPVLQGGRISGMISERDLMRALVTSGGQDIMKLPVEKLMSKKLISCGPGDDLADVMEKMDHHGIRHLPVLDEHTLVGVLSVRDVIHVLRGVVTEREVTAPAA